MFQGTVERVTKEPTVLAPSTKKIPVAAPHMDDALQQMDAVGLIEVGDATS